MPVLFTNRFILFPFFFFFFFFSLRHKRCWNYAEPNIHCLILSGSREWARGNRHPGLSGEGDICDISIPRSP